MPQLLRATARIIVVFLVVLVGTGCAGLSTAREQKPFVERNILTNLPGGNGQVIAVKFDDTKYSHPQEGLEDADVIFVTQVEGGLTRLLAIYSSKYPDQVGPVRSARISDIDILAQFGRVGFVYSGAQSKLRPLLSAANITNLSAERNPPTIYLQDPMRTAPYAMMAKLAPLLEKAGDVEVVKSVGWEHGKRSESATAIESAIIHWPSASYRAIWSETESRFLLEFDGAANLNVNGDQLGSPMMIIQKILITPSQFGDRFGGVTPKSNVVGEGDAYLLRDGTATKVRWKRSSPAEVTSWTLPDGSPALFARGQVWVFLTDREPDFAYKPVDTQVTP